MRESLPKIVKRLFVLEDTPERIALAFSLGVFLAFSPFLGFHTLLGVLFSLLFGLNRAALLLGVFVNNPWTLVPIYAAGTWLGGLLVGFPPQTSLRGFSWHELLSSGFWLELIGQWHFLKTLFLGSLVLSVIAAVFAYLTALYIIRRRRTLPVQ